MGPKKNTSQSRSFPLTNTFSAEHPTYEEVQCEKILNRSKNPILVNLQKAKARSYIESLLPEEKRSWLELDVEELKEHGRLYGQGYDVLMEALHFAGSNLTWKFWGCPKCNQKFGVSVSHWDHLIDEYTVDSLSNELKKLLPQPVNQDWADKLVSGNWVPIDVEDALMRFGTTSKCVSWPLSGDEKRRKLLKTIGDMFRILVKYNYLAVTHLDSVLNLAMSRVRAHPTASQLVKHGVNEESILCVRLLDYAGLKKVLGFLQNLWEACNLRRHSKEKSFLDDHGAVLDASGSDMLVRIFYDSNSSKLILDPRAFCNRSSHSEADSSCIDNRLRCMPDAEALVSWLYKDDSFAESLLAWNKCTELKTKRSKQIFEMLQNENRVLSNLCIKKRECLVYAGALKHAEDRIKKRENPVESEFLGYEAILKKEKEEADADSEAMVVGKAISDVLRLAKKVKNLDISDDELLESNSDDDDGNTSVSSTLNDLEDARIEKAFHTLNKRGSLKRCKIDANILRNIDHPRLLKLEFGHLGLLDFLTILTPLVKSCLQMILEEAMEVYVTEVAQINDTLINDGE